jgi:hypothetical protein
MPGVEGRILRGYLVPNRPHPLLAPERNRGWSELRAAMEEIGREIAATEADLLLIFSTRWVSIIGHQIQADPAPEWWVVDEDFHDLGTLRYRLRMDAEFAAAWCAAAQARGLTARTVAFRWTSARSRRCGCSTRTTRSRPASCRATCTVTAPKPWCSAKPRATQWRGWGGARSRSA